MCFKKSVLVLVLFIAVSGVGGGVQSVFANSQPPPTPDPLGTEDGTDLVRAPGSCATILPDPPNSTETGRLTDDNHVYVFHEKTTILNEPLHVGISKADNYANIGDLTPGNIENETLVNSFIIHFDQEQAAPLTIECEIHFNQTIAGVIVNSSNLDASDAYLGALSRTKYPTTGARGIELRTSDELIVFSTKKVESVRVNFRLDNATDQIRIITKAPRQPPPSGVYEFGDAPDPPYRTNSSRQKSEFGPTTAPMFADNALYLGENASYEKEPNLVNEDEFDDGFVPNNSTVFNLEVKVVHIDPHLTNQNPIFLNLFVDFNGDGDWQDSGEWVVKNRRETVNSNLTVNFGSTSKLLAYLNGTTSGGYTRLMLTGGNITDERRGGYSDHHFGEIEDYSQSEMNDIVEKGGKYDITLPGFMSIQAFIALIIIVFYFRRWR